jgi:Holliday junction resolvase|tara:strand:- start:844 stop:1092 length:249 start_codon:yes stop_codon:yes gene_type:complete
MSYQQKIIKEYESKGFLVIKTIRLNKSGFPDLMCLKDGKTVWIEIKEPTDTLKPLQKKRIDELIKIGFEAYCLKKNKGKIYP